MKSIKYELLVSVTAMITAVAAVVISVVQTSVMHDEAEMQRDHQRLSVAPSVWIEHNVSTSIKKEIGQLNIEIANRGLGPAMIESFSILYKGQIIKNWPEWISSFAPDLYEQGFSDGSIMRESISTLPTKYVLQNGVEHELFAIEAPLALIEQILQAKDDTDFTICSCSLYGQCWITNGLSKAPEITTQCVHNASEQFAGDIK
ncbi:MAG: hypothetical protein AB8B48_01270 [Pseudomonadales bacterium]